MMRVQDIPKPTTEKPKQEALSSAAQSAFNKLKKGAKSLKEDYETFKNPITPTDKAMRDVANEARVRAKQMLKPSPKDNM